MVATAFMKLVEGQRSALEEGSSLTEILSTPLTLHMSHCLMV